MCSVLERQPEVEVVGTAQDGRKALALAHTLHPELVLLDVQMPVMNGIEAATELSREFPAIRVVMITGHDSPEIRQACRDCGAQAFIPKEHLNQEFPAVFQQLFGSPRMSFVTP